VTSVEIRRERCVKADHSKDVNWSSPQLIFNHNNKVATHFLQQLLNTRKILVAIKTKWNSTNKAEINTGCKSLLFPAQIIQQISIIGESKEMNPEECV
jgi:hypothetical protein